jgi:hypothetical protein
VTWKTKRRLGVPSAYAFLSGELTNVPSPATNPPSAHGDNSDEVDPTRIERATSSMPWMRSTS